MSESMIEIRGFEEVARNLELLGDKVRKKITRRALREAAKPIKAEVERRAYKSPGGPTYPSLGHMADHIVVTTSIRKTGEALVKVGPDKDHWWGNFIEYGTPQFGARPFIRPGLKAAENAAYDAFAEELWKGIKEELKALGFS